MSQKIVVDADLEARIKAGLERGRRMSHETKSLQAIGRRQQFLAALRADPHARVADLTAEVGMSESWYKACRLTHKDFAAEVDAIRRSSEIGPFQAGFEKWRWDYMGRSTPWHQKLIIDAIDKAKPDDVILVLMPPEAGKTSLFEEYVTYRICTDASIRIQYMCQSPKAAMKRVGQISNYLTDPLTTIGADGTPGKLVGRFGPFVDRTSDGRRPWTANYFTVAKAPLKERNYTLEARGILSNIQGDRADLFLIDDPQDRDMLNQSKRILEKIRQEGNTRLTETGFMLWAATRVDPNDVYDLLLTMEEEEFFVDRIIEVPAIRNGESYWPDKWPLERLMRKKQKVGAQAWARCYMQQPLADGTATFSDTSMAGAKNPRLAYGVMEPMMPGLLTVDPGLAPGVCAFLVSSIVSEQKLRLVEVSSSDQYAGITDITNEMERLLIAYPGITDLCAESNTFRGALTEDATFKALVNQYGLKVHEHTTGRNKNDKDLGISALGRAYWRGEVEIPDAGDVEKLMFKKLVEQHLKWRPGVPDKIAKQDEVIIVWLAWKLLAGIRADLERARKRNLEQWRRHQADGWGKIQKIGA